MTFISVILQHSFPNSSPFPQKATTYALLNLSAHSGKHIFTSFLIDRLKMPILQCSLPGDQGKAIIKGVKELRYTQGKDWIIKMISECLSLSGNGAEGVRGREWSGNAGITENIPSSPSRSPQVPSVFQSYKMGSTWENFILTLLLQHTLGLFCTPYIKDNPTYCLVSQQELNCLNH